MEGTPRAKARRQSLPSQHHLGPSTTQNETTTQAELLRFRDEMGIYTQAHQPAHPSFDPNLVRGQGMTVSAKAPGVRNMLRVPESMTSQQGERGRSAESTYDSGPQAKVEDSDTAYSPSGPSDPNPGGNGNLTGEDFPKKKVRKKWTLEETKMLVLGCNKHGVGNWKSMLDDRELQFDPDRTPVDLKDRFRTYFPEAYRHLYPNAKTHISNSSASRANRAELPDSLTIFEKSRSKKRRPFTKEEDDALREGFEKVCSPKYFVSLRQRPPKHGTVWALIAKHPALSSRRSTDLRDRFRNAFPDLYERAGYKPRPTKPVKRRKGEEVITSVTPQVRLQPGTSKPIASSQIRELSTVREMSMEPIESSGSPDDDDSFDAAGPMTGDSGNDQPKTPQMETDPCTDTSGNFTPHKGYVHENATSMPATTSSEISVRSPGQHPQPNSSHLNPNDHLSTTQQSPAHQQQSPVHHLHPVHQQTIDDLRGLNQAWYPARWLSGTQGGYSDESTINQHTQSQQSHVSSGGGLGLNPGLPLGFGLLAGGWANQQTIIDRYDLPSSSSQFIHGGEFQSEAAIGDTGSSISGLDDYAANSQMSLSSHHRYAGDLFLARGAGYGGGGWGAWASNNFGFMLGVEPHDMPSFGRAAMDMGAPVSHSSRAASVSGASIGPHPSGLDIASATQSPEPGQMLRHDVGLDPIDGLEAVLESSILGSPHPMDPTKTLVHEVATPPPGTPAPNSPPSRSFSSLDMYGNPVVGPVPGMGLMRHASMGSVDTLGHGSQMTKRSENQHHQHQHQHQQQQSGHHSVHATHQHPGVSHSRSFSQPPSDHRIQPATGRPANTTAPSPVKAPFQHLDSRPYTSAMEALTSSVPPSSPAHRSIGVSQNDHTNSGGTSGQRSQNLHAHSESSVHIQGSHSGEQALSQQQQQRTPVQKHAILQPSTSLYQPASSTSQFNPSGAPWGQLSTAAMALDLHGYQMYQASHIYSQPMQQTASVQSLTLAGPSTGPGPYGSHVMDQYLDFETHALDLATAAGSLPVNSTISPTWATTLSPPESQPPFTPTSRHQISSNSNAYNRGQNVTSDFLTQKNTFRTPEISTTAPTSQLQNAQGHHLFGYSPPGISSMDDSMIITTPPNHGSLGGIMRRESFSYGTTPHTQATASGLMVPLNRVQSADRAVVSPNTQASQAQGASRPRGWDQTVTGRNAKRSSWGAMRSLANAT
ncbi:hypothetical protein FRC17_000515 [Serendipita sp. 399]|nr:hypothetical protein FRC17_000515 [Serendipita sp. 399]